MADDSEQFSAVLEELIEEDEDDEDEFLHTSDEEFDNDDDYGSSVGYGVGCLGDRSQLWNNMCFKREEEGVAKEISDGGELDTKPEVKLDVYMDVDENTLEGGEYRYKCAVSVGLGPDFPAGEIVHGNRASSKTDPRSTTSHGFACKDGKLDSLYRENIRDEQDGIDNRNMVIFACNFCQKQYRHKRDLRSHIRKKHPSEDLKCKLCRKEFSCKEQMVVHLKQEHDIKCEVCEEVFVNEQSFRRHITKSDKCAYITTTGQLNNTYECEICKKIFVQRKNLDLHKATHKGDHKYECIECGAHFSRGPDFKRHMWTHTGETPYQCSICQKGFRQPGEFGRHMRWHRGGNTCRYCGKRLVRDEELRRHELKHELEMNITDGILKLRCNVCGKILKDEFNLKNHIRVRHGQNEDIQSIGGDSILTSKSNTKLSIRQSIKCPLCEKVFSTNSNMNKHFRTHNRKGSALHKCDVCGKTFTRSDSMKDHIQQVHLKLRRNCSLCAGDFYNNKELRKHMIKIHSVTH
ncbi:zinc finger protein 69-like [Mya arenaria]|uniref:zinc finger protein 69-like n=1 Tax=Mya arenaria TaxID=6604 RepID=UPI0022E961BC|nr:zinc finger protein 69-like [Mya arenaria]